MRHAQECPTRGQNDAEPELTTVNVAGQLIKKSRPENNASHGHASSNSMNPY